MWIRCGQRTDCVFTYLRRQVGLHVRSTVPTLIIGIILLIGILFMHTLIRESFRLFRTAAMLILLQFLQCRLRSTTTQQYLARYYVVGLPTCSQAYVATYQQASTYYGTNTRRLREIKNIRGLCGNKFYFKFTRISPGYSNEYFGVYSSRIFACFCEVYET